MFSKGFNHTVVKPLERVVKGFILENVFKFSVINKTYYWYRTIVRLGRIQIVECYMNRLRRQILDSSKL